MNEEKFTGRAEQYARFRPSYPAQLLNDLQSRYGMTKDSVIADIGAGTGIFTKMLLSRGNTVYAVEPNDDMREKAKGALGEMPNCHIIKGTAEKTTLADKLVDFITVAQAFHWFDRPAFKSECRRILKGDTGKVILIWNCRDESTAFIQESAEINRRFCPKFTGFFGGQPVDRIEYFEDFFAPQACEARTYRNDLPLDRDGYIGRCLSSSYALKENEPGYTDYVTALHRLYEKYRQGDRIIMPNIVYCYVGSV